MVRAVQSAHVEHLLLNCFARTVLRSKQPAADKSVSKEVILTHKVAVGS